jgi:hypothetical protein
VANGSLASISVGTTFRPTDEYRAACDSKASRLVDFAPSTVRLSLTRERLPEIERRETRKHRAAAG